MDLKNTKTVWISTPYRYLDADLHSLPDEYDERKRTERGSCSSATAEGGVPGSGSGRGRGASGVQVWEGRLLWNESRIRSSPAAAVIAGGPKYLAVLGCSRPVWLAG